MEDAEDNGENNSTPSYTDLPMEIILQIFEYLNGSDRKALSTTCRRFYEAFIDPAFQSQFVLRLSHVFLSSTVPPLSILLKSTDRIFPNIYLKKIEFGNTQKFFEYFGRDIQELTIDSTDISEQQLINILKEVRSLRLLAIKHCPEIFMSGQFLRSDSDKKAVSKAFYNLKSLAIQDNRYLTDAILSRIIGLSPKLEKIDLTGCPIAFHNALCRRFYPQNSTNEPSEAILTFKYLQEVIEKYSSTLTDLDLSYTLIGSTALTTLGSINEWHLKKLSLRSCLQLTQVGLTDLFAAQSNIVYLDCSSSSLMTANWASIITELLPSLEVLKLAHCKMLTDSDAIKFTNLKNLKSLDISYCSGLTNAGLIEGLVKTKNNVLEVLNLSGLNIGESCLIQCSENLPNLRELEVVGCVTAVTDVSLQAVLKNQIWLRLLNLENCNLITDTGITGIQITSSKEKSTNTEGIVPPLTSNLMKINLRSRAEDEIVQDANRKKVLLAIIEYAQHEYDESNGYSIKRLKGLRVLNLSGCSKITDISLKYGFQFKELTTLWLSNCQQITFTGIQVLLQNCPSIEILHLLNCCNINDLTVELIAMKLKRLSFIDIRGCKQLTENNINDIHFRCKTLK